MAIHEQGELGTWDSWAGPLWQQGELGTWDSPLLQQGESGPL